MGFIPRPYQVDLILERLDLRSVNETDGTPDLARRFASGQAMGTIGPVDGVNKLGQAPRHTADSSCFRVDRSEPVPFIHSLVGPESI
jgi:hypothetical protein